MKVMTRIRIYKEEDPTSVIIIPSQEVVEETEADTFAQARSGLKETGTAAGDSEVGGDAEQHRHQVPIPKRFINAPPEPVLSQYTPRK